MIKILEQSFVDNGESILLHALDSILQFNFAIEHLLQCSDLRTFLYTIQYAYVIITTIQSIWR